jgi:hypothetical protein
MDRRIARIGPGLLAALRLNFFFFLSLAVLPSVLWAQDFAAPRILVQSAPETPAAGSFWTLTILVDHPVPAEIEVRPPPFPAAFTRDRLLRETRLIQGDDAQYQRWTAVEYSFLLSVPGTFTLGPFEILGPMGSALTAPISITVTGASPEKSKLAWEGVPPRLTVGQSAVFALKMILWPANRPLPPSALFLPVPPRGMILEEVRQGDSRQAQDRAVLYLHLIPLEAGLFYLPPRRLEYEGIVLEIPPLRIPVADH